MTTNLRTILSLAVLALTFSSVGILTAAEKDDAHFFETKVRPLLAQHCFECHGPKEQKSDLRLDRRGHFLKGGSGGPIVEPGKPDESELIASVKYETYEMPPKGQLPDEQIAILETWVERGAFWPETEGDVREDELFTKEDLAWWAFQPVTRPEVPPADAATVQNSIDHFILAKLADEQIPAAPPAEKRDLIRRLYFDMLGVPPTPEEINAFVNSKDEDAYEKLVDQVLADARYGQRWATHWLDLVRYADSDGYRQDAYRPNAWRYRDYVVKSLNEDKSYKQFMQEQLAGDEIAPNDPDALVATHFLRGGVYEYNSRDAKGQQVLISDELTDTVGDVFLGMGIACAHCHNHKYDPILRDDYYRLQAFFKPMVWKDDVPLVSDEEQANYHAALAEWEAKHQELLDKIEAIEGPARKKMERKAVTMFPEEIQVMYWKPKEERNTYENQIHYLVYDQVKFEYSRLKNGIPKEDRPKWEALKKELQGFLTTKPKPLPVASVAGDADGTIAPTTIPDDRSRREIPPGFLTILDPNNAEINADSVPAETTSGRRTALARWLSRDDNPLSPRVIVNRVWQYHFGTGLSANASDFGRLGEAPSHPQLLDWLTSEFIDNGWHLKPLHRDILLSATYRQSSLVDMPEKAALVDPKNRLLWKFPARRLEAEQIRDAMLAVSGELGDKSDGPASSSNSTSRSIFTKKMRNSPDALLDSFDAPKGFASVAQRNSTTTATQSLLMFNGDWTLKRAEAMAKRLDREFGNNYAAMIRDSFLRGFGREPSDAELEASVSFIEEQIAYNEKLAKASQEEIPSTALVDEPQMQRWSTAFQINDSKPHELLTLPETKSLPSHNFTIEAIVFPRKLFPDASVRTIAARWNGSNSTPGWNFGITSEKSAYRPRNLILQLIGNDQSGKVKYEVVASNLRIPSDKPYYVAAAVDFDAGTATFFARDMSYDESELETAVVKHSIVGRCGTESLRFTVGGRDAKSPHNFDGLIDDVRLTRTAITDPKKIMINDPNNLVTEDTVAMWRFVRSDAEGPLSDVQDKHPLQLSLRSKSGGLSPVLVALGDYCHVLLNSSEFQFVD
ncbi:PSD1 and planctomycete cytochrome C domain-containing protein [Blastopirellula marina]|uniref:Cytochrome c domain-containing protein n=1 Tax=Blastopirellula marina TaxID=124 RepID=A0A2S8GLS2_9BACT|nr:DUF1549 domain-containing protein [Blastopirellula marina]PQO45382.1 hypothetical protein C5Y93_13090 [Blastopirellula marina]